MDEEFLLLIVMGICKYAEQETIENHQEITESYSDEADMPKEI